MHLKLFLSFYSLNWRLPVSVRVGSCRVVSWREVQCHAWWVSTCKDCNHCSNRHLCCIIQFRLVSSSWTILLVDNVNMITFLFDFLSMQFLFMDLSGLFGREAAKLDDRRFLTKRLFGFILLRHFNAFESHSKYMYIISEKSGIHDTDEMKMTT